MNLKLIYMKRHFILVTLLLPVLFVKAQDTESSKVVPQKYDRVALTSIVLENSAYNDDIVPAANHFIIPSKFDDNLVETRSIKSEETSESIANEMINSKIANQIVAKWFSRNPETGQFDMSVIHERGMYNATDDEVIRASASKIGLAKLKDAGESLIDNSYIVVLRFKNIQSMEEIYDKRDIAKKASADILNKEFEPVKRVKNGWEGKVTAYLFKLDFTDDTFSQFYNDMWIYEDDTPEIIAEKKAMFEQFNFPAKFIMKVDANADGSQYNPDHILAPKEQLTREGLFQKMVNTGLDNSLFLFESDVEDFKVKAPLYNDRPLQAKIGRKEGLRTDARYFILENEQNRKGEMVSKRKGVVRAKKIIDNRKVATGDSKEFSTFYQTAGRNLDPGMLLYQKNDFGLGLSGGISSGGIGGGYFKVEANINSLAGRIFDIDIPQLKLFGALGFDGGEYEYSGNTYNNMSFTRMQVGLSKGFYFARNFSLAPFVSYGIESATGDMIEDNLINEEISSDFLIGGAYLTMNLTHCIQIMAAANFYVPFGNAYDKDKNSLGKMYTDYFNDREGASIDLGLRIEF